MTTFTGDQISNDLQFDLNKNYELIIIDPETDAKTRVRIKKVGYFVNINPESIQHLKRTHNRIIFSNRLLTSLP